MRYPFLHAALSVASWLLASCDNSPPTPEEMQDQAATMGWYMFDKYYCDLHDDCSAPTYGQQAKKMGWDRWLVQGEAQIGYLTSRWETQIVGPVQGDGWYLCSITLEGVRIKNDNNAFCNQSSVYDDMLQRERREEAAREKVIKEQKEAELLAAYYKKYPPKPPTSDPVSPPRRQAEEKPAALVEPGQWKVVHRGGDGNRLVVVLVPTTKATDDTFIAEIAKNTCDKTNCSILRIWPEDADWSGKIVVPEQQSRSQIAAYYRDLHPDRRMKWNCGYFPEKQPCF